MAQLIKAGRVRRLVCMCGAGISVSAGDLPTTCLTHVQSMKFSNQWVTPVFMLCAAPHSPRLVTQIGQLFNNQLFVPPICVVINGSPGIPDFRTPGTGLYSQLDAYNLPAPEAIFTLSYFRCDITTDRAVEAGSESRVGGGVMVVVVGDAWQEHWSSR